MKKYLWLILLVILYSCERIELDNISTKKSNIKDNVSISITQIGQTSFTRSSVSIPLSRLSFAVFDSLGNKVYSKNQIYTDSNYGNISSSFNENQTYTVVIIGHDGDGNCTITSPSKVTFYNNKCTDTFCGVGNFNTSTNGFCWGLSLNRSVSLIKITDSSESIYSKYKFYYTGGSSTLNPSLGVGCVASKQTEYRDYSKHYELYTFPRTESEVINLTVSALDSDGSELRKTTLNNIPVVKNKITTVNTSLFSGSSNSIDSISFNITIDTNWEDTITYSI